MRIFAISDLHIDYENNREWLFDVSKTDYQEDILILAGDITDSPVLLEQCFKILTACFKKVLYVPGNHDLWVVRDKLATSFKKYDYICHLARDYDVSMETVHFGEVSVVPIMGWYDYSFGNPCEKLLSTWADYVACHWPDAQTPNTISEYFTEKNRIALNTTNEKIISFSHFLPRIDLMPEYIPEHHRFLYPVLGSNRIEEQLRALGSTLHIYGHSHVNRNIEIDGVTYINNAFGYPSETRITSKQLLCVFEQ